MRVGRCFLHKISPIIGAVFPRIHDFIPYISSSTEVTPFWIKSLITHSPHRSSTRLLALSRVTSDHCYVLWIWARQKTVRAVAHMEPSNAGWLVAGQTKGENIEVILKLLHLLGHQFGFLLYIFLIFCIVIQLFLKLNLADIIGICYHNHTKQISFQNLTNAVKYEYLYIP